MSTITAATIENYEANAVEAIEHLADRKAWKQLAGLIEPCAGLLPKSALEKHHVRNTVESSLGMKTV